jgi:hypothetical protein
MKEAFVKESCRSHSDNVDLVAQAYGHSPVLEGAASPVSSRSLSQAKPPVRAGTAEKVPRVYRKIA